MAGFEAWQRFGAGRMRFGAIAATARRIGLAGLDLLLPPGCMACDAPVSGAFQLCAACFSRCHFITAPMCRVCGVPFGEAAQGGVRSLCPSCASRRPVFGQARAALSYDSHSRGLLLQFKHADRTELARLFAPMMARAAGAMLEGADWLVPVPLHRSRTRLRGYNQAALLAQALSRICQVPPLLDGLKRIRRTPSLGAHDAAGRARILNGAVVANPRRAADLAGGRIVLVDDVMTSGATTNACAGALLAAGALHVNVLAVARVPDPGLRALNQEDADATG